MKEYTQELKPGKGRHKLFVEGIEYIRYAVGGVRAINKVNYGNITIKIYYHS